MIISLFMFYVDIIYSAEFDKYYTGYSNNPYRRLIEHNTSLNNTYTSKYRPWKLMAVLECGKNETIAINIERFIKKQKSRKLIEQLIDANFTLTGFLAQLVRVPHLRDASRDMRD